MLRKPGVGGGSASSLYAGISMIAIDTQKSFVKRARFNRKWIARG